MGDLVAYDAKYQTEVQAVELQRGIAEQAVTVAKFELMRYGLMQRELDARIDHSGDYDHRPF